MSGFQSGMTDPGDTAQRHDELFPAAALAGEHAAAGGRDAVEAAAPLARLLDPAPLNQLPALEAIEHGIERGDVELEHALRSLFDQLADLVAVPGAVLDQG